MLAAAGRAGQGRIQVTVFPDSAFDQRELNLETINTKVKERAFGLYNKLRGAS
jgi:hypothetical protein